MKFYKHHNDWECYKLGLYKKGPTRPEKVAFALNLLSTPSAFGVACDVSLATMKNSALHHITAMSNPKSWVGQAACFFMGGCTELETRAAWARIPIKKQKDANRVAQLAINRFFPKSQLTLF